MDPRETPSQSPPPPINPDGMKPIYANSLGISGTQTDTLLIFTQVCSAIYADGTTATENMLKAMVTIPVAIVPHLISGLQEFLLKHNSAISGAQVDEKRGSVA